LWLEVALLALSSFTCQFAHCTIMASCNSEQRFRETAALSSCNGSNLQCISLSTMSFVSQPSVTSPEPIWLDCDPGHDDMMAIIMAVYSPLINLLGISTISGNQTIEKTTINTLNTLQSCAIHHIPVYQGRHEPLIKQSMNCGEIHGVSGLDGADFPPLNLKISPGKAYEMMWRAILSYAQEQRILSSSNAEVIESLPYTEPNKQLGHENGVTIVATGPLTNVALMLLAHPEAKRLIKRVGQHEIPLIVSFSALISSN
jgi:hypothetical protein